jgi:hypothetical protein
LTDVSATVVAVVNGVDAVVVEVVDGVELAAVVVVVDGCEVDGVGSEVDGVVTTVDGVWVLPSPWAGFVPPEQPAARQITAKGTMNLSVLISPLPRWLPGNRPEVYGVARVEAQWAWSGRCTGGLRQVHGSATGHDDGGSLIGRE